MFKNNLRFKRISDKIQVNFFKNQKNFQYQSLAWFLFQKFRSKEKQVTFNKNNMVTNQNDCV